jgi:flagellar biosynthetic protein FliR
MNEFAAATRFALLLVRPGMLVMGTPYFGGAYAPATMRAGLTMLFAFMLAPLVPAPADLTMGTLTFVVLREMLIGTALAVGVRVLLSAADMAGQLLGFQIGLSFGSLVDPQSGVRNGVLASLYSNLVIILALIGGAHHAVIRAMAASYAALPIGVGHVDGALVPATARLLGMVMVLGVRIAGPVVVVLLATELLLGFMARVAPSFNVLVVGAPARLVIGLVVAAATLATLPPLVARYGPITLDLAVQTARAFR